MEKLIKHVPHTVQNVMGKIECPFPNTCLSVSSCHFAQCLMLCQTKILS